MNVNTVINFELLKQHEGASKIYRLDNPILGTYDPYDQNLTDEIKSAMLDEMKLNIWYFIREVVRFKDNVDGHAIVPMINEVVYNLLSGAESVRHTYVVAPRLTFKTSAALAVGTWFVLRGIQVQLSAPTAGSVDNLIQRMTDELIMPDFVKDHFTQLAVAIETPPAVLIVSDYEFTNADEVFALIGEKNFSLILIETCASKVPVNFELMKENLDNNVVEYKESTIESLGLPNEWVEAMKKNLLHDEASIQSEIFLNRYYEQKVEIIPEGEETNE